MQDYKHGERATKNTSVACLILHGQGLLYFYSYWYCSSMSRTSKGVVVGGSFPSTQTVICTVCIIPQPGDSAQERHILHSNNIHSIIYVWTTYLMPTNYRIVSPSGVGPPPGHTGIYTYIIIIFSHTLLGCFSRPFLYNHYLTQVMPLCSHTMHAHTCLHAL